MKKILFSSLAVLALMLNGCGEDDLVPQVDTSNEYEKYIIENKDRTPADSTIYEWYRQYNTYFIYHFRDEDIKWQWAGKMMLDYSAFDPEKESDMKALVRHLNLIKQSFLEKYDESFLRKCLPYKIFLIKNLQQFAGGSLSWAYYPCISNGQDAMMVAYLQSNGRAYSTATMESEMSNVFGKFFYSKLDVKPVKFINSRVKVNYTLVTTPQDPNIEAELAIKPDFSNAQHYANVCGFVKAYLPTFVKEPTEEEDFADYLWFITQNRGSWIRQRTQFYKRLAQRGTYFIEFYKEQMGQDLIESQNNRFPEDPVSIDDFKFQ
ncbi:MAG: hypothetical protein IJ605_05870 [Prevotella sp.]|nr:hypothetical protein [Prevotella sp.]